MAALLRQIVAGPRARHPDAGLDLCYVTPNIIATSGPSQTYPKRAYRNPLDRLVGFLDEKHGDGWAIWEFRAEGTGYPDEAVYGRVRHYPWPDHHPPPFRLMPMIVASMQKWLEGGPLLEAEGPPSLPKAGGGPPLEAEAGGEGSSQSMVKQTIVEEAKKKPAIPVGEGTKDMGEAATGRVVVVHCKAGKGRSGTAAVSYLISECGWTAEEALGRFTERRMRRGFGAGVSIPSQLRAVRYVDRWARPRRGAAPAPAPVPIPAAAPVVPRRDRHYVDRAVEIVEVHAWGLRDGVKLEIGGYADEGKRIQVLHAFTRPERIIVEAGNVPQGNGVRGLADVVYDMLGYGLGVDASTKKTEDADPPVATSPEGGGGGGGASSSGGVGGAGGAAKVRRRTTLVKKRRPTDGAQPEAATAPAAPATPASGPSPSSSTATTTTNAATTAVSATTSSVPSPSPSPSVPTPSSQTPDSDVAEPGGQAVIFKPEIPIRVDNSDVLVRLERRSRGPRSIGLTMITASAHAWFNAFFEGDGPERMAEGEEPARTGVFEIGWDDLDGFKGSSRKGTRAVDRIAVVWRIAGEGGASEGAGQIEPAAAVEEKLEVGQTGEVPQMRPADWRGSEPAEEEVEVEDEAGLGVRSGGGEERDLNK